MEQHMESSTPEKAWRKKGWRGAWWGWSGQWEIQAAGDQAGRVGTAQTGAMPTHLDWILRAKGRCQRTWNEKAQGQMLPLLLTLPTSNHKESHQLLLQIHACESALFSLSLHHLPWVQGMITAPLEIWTGLFAGLTVSILTPLQHIPHRAARGMFNL